VLIVEVAAATRGVVVQSEIVTAKEKVVVRGDVDMTLLPIVVIGIVVFVVGLADHLCADNTVAIEIGDQLNF